MTFIFVSKNTLATFTVNAESKKEAFRQLCTMMDENHNDFRLDSVESIENGFMTIEKYEETETID